MAVEKEVITRVNVEKGIFFKASKIVLLGGLALLGALAIVRIYQHLKDTSAHPEDKKRPKPTNTPIVMPMWRK